MICVSCKNKTSTDRCPNKPLKGLSLCGTHAKSKTKRLWTVVNHVDEKVTKIQKFWRGYRIRSWIQLAGPGVLKRSICHNDEELVTMDEKTSVSPLDYFAFEEAGKVYWFDVRSLVQNSHDKLHPTNPYTREPLSIDTRQRLRKISLLRHHRRIPNLHQVVQGVTSETLLSDAWISVCQIIEENGFPDMSQMLFVALNRPQLYIFITMIHQDLIAWAAEHTTPTTRRRRYIPWTRHLIGEYVNGLHYLGLSFMTAKCLLAMLNDYPDPYPLCFIIMSALHRV